MAVPFVSVMEELGYVMIGATSLTWIVTVVEVLPPVLVPVIV